jgi:hypothetical protein
MPASYQVRISEGEPDKGRWFELDSDVARKWILLAENLAGITNGIRVTRGDGLVFEMPNMLPCDWSRAFLANSAAVLATEKGWRLVTMAEQSELLLELLKLSNIRLI